MKMSNKKFNKLLRTFCIPTSKMRPYLKREVLKHSAMSKGHYGKNFLYFKGNLPVLLVAHFDTVHSSVPTLSSIAIYKDRVTAPFTGLGADDRLGIFGVLEMLERGFYPDVVFLDKEEVGGIGAKEFATWVSTNRELAPSVKFMIELDRMNKDDAAMYSCANIDFMSFLKGFGYVPAGGTYTDICDIMPALDRAGTNISVGYYRQHTFSEYFCISEFELNLDRLENILISQESVGIFSHMKKVSSFSGYGRGYRRDNTLYQQLSTHDFTSKSYYEPDYDPEYDEFDNEGFCCICGADSADGFKIVTVDDKHYCTECATLHLPYYKTKEVL